MGQVTEEGLLFEGKRQGFPKETSLGQLILFDQAATAGY
jgi:hypothetical protein